MRMTGRIIILLTVRVTDFTIGSVNADGLSSESEREKESTYSYVAMDHIPGQIVIIDTLSLRPVKF